MLRIMTPSPDSTTTSIRTSYCPLDCPDSCSLAVEVENDRVVKLDGDHRNPVTDGFICTKVRHFPERVYGPDRLLYPAIRVGKRGAGEWRRASWDEALSLIVDRLRSEIAAHGGECVLPFCYGGSNGILSQNSTDLRFFRRLGSSQLARTVCAAETTAAAQTLYGKMPGVAYPDFAESKCIVVWGANPSAASIHSVPHVLEAKRRGARLIVVDPRRIPLARQADLHLAVRPGTDLPVALSLIRWFFEEGHADETFLAAHADGVARLRESAREWTFERAAAVAGVEAADLARLAELYAEASPALVRCGWGVERNRNGGSAVAAILALPAVAGKFGVRGGGYTLSNSSGWNLDTAAAVGEPAPKTRVLNMNRLGHDLTELEKPPIRALFVYNCNPLMTLPDQERVRRGLEREDLFTVVFEQVWTDTAKLADVVLPATTFLEHSDMSRGYGSYVVQRSQPVVPPAGEARSNFEVFLELTRRFGLARPGDAETIEEFATAALAANGRASELAAELASNGIAAASPAAPVQFGDVRPRTANGRIQLAPESLPELYRYREEPRPGALALISPANNRFVSSTLGEIDRRPTTLAMHPDDAAARGLHSGDRVRVANELGEVVCPLELTAEMRPGVVYLAKGLWSHHTENGRTSNALSPATLGPLAGGACFNDARVEVTRERGAQPTHQVSC